MVVGVSDFDGAQGPAGGWWRGWTPWISALVLAALFAGASSGIAFVRRSYVPPVDYPAMTESEPEGSASPASAEHGRDEDRPGSRSSRPTGAPTGSPENAPRKLGPSASGRASAGPKATAEPSESPPVPLGRLGELLGLGGGD